MSKYSIENTTLISIADAIREKTGGTDAILVADFPEQILSIESGGSLDDIDVLVADYSATADNTVTQGELDVSTRSITGE